jgi:hypothetical protein
MPTMSERRAAWNRGYEDAKQGRPMAIRWGTGGVLGHRYGMGYFHGRAHHPNTGNGAVSARV